MATTTLDNPTAPVCPECEKPMVIRTAKQGNNPGSRFWGCSGYPDCRKTLPLKKAAGGRADGSAATAPGG